MTNPNENNSVDPNEESSQFDAEETVLDSDFAELLDAKTRKKPVINGVVIGSLVDFTNSANPIVTIPMIDTERRVSARTIVPLKKEDIGREVAISFENGEPDHPIILGLLHKAAETEVVSMEELEVEKQEPINCEVAIPVELDLVRTTMKSSTALPRLEVLWVNIFPTGCSKRIS